jgi:biotin transport system substrate-specific component
MEHTEHKNLYERFFGIRNVYFDIMSMVFAVVGLAVLSNIRINMWPVPITMQTFGVMLIAFFFGTRKGVMTIVLYVLSGIAGLGVFSGFKSGLSAVMGPTGGYIMGFLMCVAVIGLLVEKGYGRNMRSVIGLMALGNGIIYLFGLIGLGFYMPEAGLGSLIMMGLVPFVVGDIIKIGLAASFLPKLWK